MIKFFCNLRYLICICTLMMVLPGNILAVNFSISPIRVFFDASQKTNTLTIKNESDEPVTLQLKAVEWGQDEDARSVYSPTRDIIFFPKLVSIEPNQKKLVRLGAGTAHTELEKTYRLFIEEIPQPGLSDTTAVKIVMKVGVPVFIAPMKDEVGGNIETISLLKSELSMKVRNEGNTHFTIRSIKVAGNNSFGEEVYSAEIGGGYVHGGKDKGFTIKIPEAKCLEMQTMNIEIKTDRLSLGKKLDVVKKMCTL